MIYDFVYMKVALEAELKRETIHGKDFFRNHVYENYAPKLDSGEKLYMEGLFR